MSGEIVELADGEDVVRARHVGRSMARCLGFGAVDQTRLATAISEIARNAVEYGGGGTCEVTDATENGRPCVRVVVTDQGPGIADVEQAMRDGFTTGSGLGAGLSGARRLVQRFEIDSAPGGTRVLLEMKKGR